MKITSYGLFWRKNGIDWSPGQGHKNVFRLLGRVGTYRGNIKIANFRKQRGIYILYDEYGPSYVGLTREQGLGKRLKDHLSDNLKEKWDRFSWFGFGEIGGAGNDGILPITESHNNITEDTNTTIGDLEALLIRAIGPKYNTAWMKFKDASEWIQISHEDTDKYLKRLEAVE